MVGVIAHQGRHVEGDREPRLAVVEQVVEALVGLLDRAEAGELAHRPEPPPVHRLIRPPRERELAGAADRRVGVGGGVVRRVERLDRAGRRSSRSPPPAPAAARPPPRRAAAKASLFPARPPSELQALHLEQLLDREAPVLAAVAGLLVAAERRQRVVGAAVDLDLAGADPPGDGDRPLRGRPTRRRLPARSRCRWRSAPRRRRPRRAGSPAPARRSPPGRSSSPASPRRRRSGGRSSRARAPRAARRRRSAASRPPPRPCSM